MESRSQIIMGNIGRLSKGPIQGSDLESGNERIKMIKSNTKSESCLVDWKEKPLVEGMLDELFKIQKPQFSHIQVRVILNKL